MAMSQSGRAPVCTLGCGEAGMIKNNNRIMDIAIRMRGLWLLGDAKLKKKGQDRNPAPFLNPISYEKPSSIIQLLCRNTRQDPGVKNIALLK